MHVHYGVHAEKSSILRKLFDSRKERLVKCEINITFDELLNMYNISTNLVK